jgi:hypothetical protein
MNQIVVRPPTDQTNSAPSRLPVVNAGFFDLQSFELMQRVAKGFCASTLVPRHYQGNTPEAIGNCMIALNLAKRIGADPLMVMQNLAVVHGRPSWSSQFLIASVNTCGRFTALRYEFFGTQGQDDWGCRAWATEKSTGEKLVGADISMALAKKEGWYGRKDSKWQTMPQQMLIYRAGAWWTRAYAPELSMGLMTADEVDDVIDLAPADYQTVDASRVQASAPQSISSRLDQFASDGDPDSQASASAPAAEPAEPEAQVALPEASDASAPSDALTPAGPDGADNADLPANIRDAVARGRGARRDGFPREVPKGYHYKSRQPEADAFLRGWDEENSKINVEQFGTV